MRGNGNKNKIYINALLLLFSKTVVKITELEQLMAPITLKSGTFICNYYRIFTFTNILAFDIFTNCQNGHF
jgi:hypothetical protein